MSPYKIPLPIEAGFVSPFSTGERAFRVEAVNDKVDASAGTRSLTLEITHPGLIWTGEWFGSVFIYLCPFSHAQPSDCL